MKCFKNRGDEAIYEADETSCWSLPLFSEYNLRQGHWRIEQHNGLSLLCDEPPRGCLDAYGRRYDNSGDRELTLPDRFSGYWSGVCPPLITSPCPSAQCSLTPLPEVGGPEDPPGSGRYGKCWGERQPRYSQEVNAAVQAVLARPGQQFDDGRVTNEDNFMAAVIEELQAQGFCVTRGGPEDEIGVKRDQEWSEQYDLLVGSSTPRHPAANYTVACKPARF